MLKPESISLLNLTEQEDVDAETYIDLFNVMIPKEKRDSEDYWENNGESIAAIIYTQPLLEYALYAFETKEHKRRDALHLIVLSGFAWQLIRSLSNITGCDQEWISGQDKRPSLTFPERAIAIIAEIKTLYEYNTALRHPREIISGIDLSAVLFTGEIQADLAKKLISASRHILGILDKFTYAFDIGGFEDEVDRKKGLHKKYLGNDTLLSGHGA